MNSIKTKLYLLASGLLILFSLNGCSSDDSANVPDPVITPMPTPIPTLTFELEMTNLTNGQPFSPIAFVMHDEEAVWEIGTAASDSLEQLAESGNSEMVRGLDFVLAETSSPSPLIPGETTTLQLSFEQSTNPRYVSVLTMLVNTNDAFIGVNKFDISQLSLGNSQSFYSRAYDAGTEANSELAGTIPGPADMGEGFNVIRDDTDYVAFHPGVVSNDDGLTGSVLSEAHRFDNPVAKITLTRIE